MMTSEAQHPVKEAYVWIWLPKEAEPTPCGRLFLENDQVRFHYGQKYLERQNAIPIFRDLPLERGVFEPAGMMTMPASLRDASPDAWGRRVIEATAGRSIEGFSEIDYLLRSGSDRIGALDFQRSPSRYMARSPMSLPIEELDHAAEALEKGEDLTTDLKLALQRGTSIGGARPKSLFEEAGRHFIAKYSLSQDIIPVNKAEAASMMIAKDCGLSVASTTVRTVNERDILMIERFDRQQGSAGMERLAMVSGLTVLGLDEMEARYAGYDLLADNLRKLGKNPDRDIRELFSRMTYNILCGNTDDHARNHAFFWDGQSIELTPAYDVCPQIRSGGEASQAMRITGARNDSTIAACLEAAPVSFGLSQREARRIITSQVDQIAKSWNRVCDKVGLTDAERGRLVGRQFLNPYTTFDLDDGDPVVDSISLARDHMAVMQVRSRIEKGYLGAQDESSTDLKN